jgi:hypothetical protein
MLNAFRKILRPTLRQQLEDGVREALRRYADRRTAPDLRVYVSTDLVPAGMGEAMWARDEADHLRRFSAQWAQDNGIARAGLRVELVLLDTKREFAFVKPLGLEQPKEEPPAPRPAAPRGPDRAMVPATAAQPFGAPQPGYGGGGGGGGAVLQVVASETVRDPIPLQGEVVVGRKAEAGVFALGDRYMSGRHARFAVRGGQVTVTDLDSKNRTFVNDTPLPPHQEHPLNPGDTIRMGNTVLRLAQG